MKTQGFHVPMSVVTPFTVTIESAWNLSYDGMSHSSQATENVSGAWLRMIILLFEEICSEVPTILQ